MRENLYKAKRLDNGEWVEGDVLKSDEHYFIIPSMGVCCVEEYEHAIANKFIQLYAYEVDPETICQYTGQTDKNENNIFENDRVVARDGSRTTGTVKFGLYDGKHYGFHIVWDGLCAYRKEICYWANNNLIKVIGNIYDNRELLETK